MLTITSKALVLIVATTNSVTVEIARALYNVISNHQNFSTTINVLP